MSTEPIDLTAAFDTFEALWSPRIVTRVNDYDVRIAKVAGEHVWHAHESTDEFFLVLQGILTIEVRDGEPGAHGPAERAVELGTGSVFVVPRGVEHRPSSASGARILMFEPAGTSTVGAQSEIPAHVDATTGHPLGE